MREPLRDMLELLDLEKIEEDRFRGKSMNLGGKSVFGGQVLGQALMAAGRTVAGRHTHSLHAYFLRPGDMTAPIVFQVERIRDGASFGTRRVVASQHGRAIFTMAASFQREEGGFDHQVQMPAVSGPEGLPSILELRRKMMELQPERFPSRPIRELPIDIRPLQPANPYAAEAHPPLQKVWFRAAGRLPDDSALHRCVLAYASDFTLLATSALPHAISLRDKNLQAASLDHAMWFHRPCRADRWLLFEMESPSASNGRGLSLGNIFSEEGILVATVAQEGLIRLRPGA